MLPLSGQSFRASIPATEKTMLSLKMRWIIPMAAMLPVSALFGGQKMFITECDTTVRDDDRIVTTIHTGHLVTVVAQQGQWRLVKEFNGWVESSKLVAPKDAIRYFNTGISNTGKSCRYFGRGKAYLYYGLSRLAIRDFTKTLQVRRQYVLAYYYRGLAYEKSRNLRQAEYDLARFARLTTNKVDAKIANGDVVRIQKKRLKVLLASRSNRRNGITRGRRTSTGNYGKTRRTITKRPRLSTNGLPEISRVPPTLPQLVKPNFVGPKGSKKKRTSS